MRGELQDWKNGWYGLELGISLAEIDSLIELLQMIRNAPEQHFHISSDYKGTGGLGDIEIFVLPAGQSHNMSLSGGALSPGDVIPDPGVN
jgi:hypothetical protein